LNSVSVDTGTAATVLMLRLLLGICASMPGCYAYQFQESRSMLRSPGSVTGKIEDFVAHFASIVAIWICSTMACGLAN
jgi:hypothetical protein